MRLIFSLFLLLLVVSSVQADWWDDFADSVAEKLKSAADWIKESAAPSVREKFNSVKATLQDPETHRQAKEWLSEKAEKASEFAQTEVLPELKKIYEAATNDEKKTE